MSTVIYPSPIFGPVHSRRLGISLGINLMPPDGKVCTFDCIYCECGFNADRRPRLPRPTRPEVKTALEAQLQKMKADPREAVRREAEAAWNVRFARPIREAAEEDEDEFDEDGEDEEEDEEDEDDDDFMSSFCSFAASLMNMTAFERMRADGKETSVITLEELMKEADAQRDRRRRQ